MQAAQHRNAPLLPGILLATGLAVVAVAISLTAGHSLSPLTVALVLGVGLRASWLRSGETRDIFAAGIAFSMRRILRIAVALLGLQLTLSQVLKVGETGTVALLFTVAATFLFGEWLGRRLAVAPRLASLLAAGTAICGASAVVAAGAVLPTEEEGGDGDVAYAVAMVTVFGSLCMVMLPLVAHWAEMAPDAFGLWCGISMHEVAQVVAAADQYSPLSTDVGTVAKLTRVVLLVPVMALLARRAEGDAVHSSERQPKKGLDRLPVPFFVLGFLLCVGLASSLSLPKVVLDDIALGDRFLLAMALAAMGLSTDGVAVIRRGYRPLALAAGLTVFIVLFSLACLRGLPWILP